MIFQGSGRTDEMYGSTKIEVDYRDGVKVRTGSHGSSDMMSQVTRLTFTVGRTEFSIVGSHDEIEKLVAKIAKIKVAW